MTFTASEFYGEGFPHPGLLTIPSSGCSDSAGSNADFRADDMWLLYNALKKMCATPIQLAYYLLF